MTDHNIELTRRKILAATGAIGAAGAGAGVGTTALFSDEESFDDNSITAGTLDMTVDAKVPAGAINDEWAGAVDFTKYNPGTADGQPGVGVTLGDMKPGDWVVLCYEIGVQDNPACLGLKTENTANDENSVNEPEASREDDISGNLTNPNTSVDTAADIDGEGELAQNLDITVYDDFDDTVAINGDLSNAQTALSNELLGGVTLQDVWDTFDTGDAIADNTNSFDFYVLLELPIETGNEVQSDSVEWDFVFDAVQSRNTDEDPYGNQCVPVWGDDCTPECPSPTNPDPGTDDFGVSIEGIDDSNFPTIEATTRVETTAGGNGDLTESAFMVDEETPSGIGSGFCGQTIEDVRFGQAQDQTEADVMLVLDRSGSMTDGTGKFQSAKDGAYTLIGGDADANNDPDTGGLDPTVNAGLVSFGGFPSDSNIVTLDQGLTTNHSAVESEVGNLVSDGGTPMAEAINEAQAEIDANGDSTTPSYIVLLANGGADDNTATRQAARDARGVTDLNNDGDATTIISIAYGSSPDEDLMEDLSSPPKIDDGTIDGDDANAFVGETDDISTVFSDIGDVISGTYTIEYETANCETDGLDRNIEVYVNDSAVGDANATGSYTAPSN